MTLQARERLSPTVFRLPVEKIRDGYGKIPASTIPEEDTQPEPPQGEPRSAVMKKPTASEKVLFGYHGPALGDADHVPHQAPFGPERLAGMSPLLSQPLNCHQLAPTAMQAKL